MNKLLASSAALFLIAGAGPAFAADLDGDGYDDDTGDPVSTETEEDTSGGGGGTDTPKPDAGGGAANPYTMGISVPLIGSDFSALASAFGGGTTIGTANFLWALGDNWLDLGVGLRVSKTLGDPTATPPTEDATTVGFDLQAGYRMMKPTKGRVMPYLMPFVEFGIADFSAAGDTLIVGAGAALGVDVLIVEQFTLGARIGVGMRTSNAFDTFDITTDTSALNATIWW